ncbi:MAG TPA: hypothetical protein VEQ42_13425 [Pyrinomonadaceae bacterium]|nr:hypothetical protein [Pyrinomonadaceae bacterium]
MKRRSKQLLILLTAALVVVAALLAPPESAAQCALCKLSAAAGGVTRVRALHVGIIVLLLPPVGIFCTIFVVAYKHRRARGEG